MVSLNSSQGCEFAYNAVAQMGRGLESAISLVGPSARAVPELERFLKTKSTVWNREFLRIAMIARGKL